MLPVLSLQTDLLHKVVKKLEETKYITDSLSHGDTKFMVHSIPPIYVIYNTSNVMFIHYPDRFYTDLTVSMLP